MEGNYPSSASDHSRRIRDDVVSVILRHKLVDLLAGDARGASTRICMQEECGEGDEGATAALEGTVDIARLVRRPSAMLKNILANAARRIVHKVDSQTDTEMAPRTFVDIQRNSDPNET